MFYLWLFMHMKISLAIKMFYPGISWSESRELILLIVSYLEWDFFVWQLIFFFQSSVLASVCRYNRTEVYHIFVHHFQSFFVLIVHRERPDSMTVSFFRSLSKKMVDFRLYSQKSKIWGVWKKFSSCDSG